MQGPVRSAINAATSVPARFAAHDDGFVAYDDPRMRRYGWAGPAFPRFYDSDEEPTGRQFIESESEQSSDDGRLNGR